MTNLINKVLAKAGVFMLAFFVMSQTVLAEEKSLSEAIKEAHKAGKLDGLHSVVIYRHGKVIGEAYFEGEDQAWGRSLGVVKHNPDSLHDLRSVSKSIVGLLYGIALRDGIVPKPSEKLLDQFPEYPELTKDPKRASITIEDVLSMRMGTEWNENLPYTDPRNSEIAMERSDDRYHFVLSRTMVEKPGTVWSYNGGATAILGRLISKGAKMPLDVYAKEKLFGPLDISEFNWAKGKDGEVSAASGLRLKVHDLAKIGLVMMAKGQYEGEEVIPFSWIKEMMSPRTKTQSGLRYGYQWYMSPGSNTPFWYSGFGNGGQRLTLQPGFGVVLALFAGNYNKRDGWKMPVRLIEEILVPALRKQ